MILYFRGCMEYKINYKVKYLNNMLCEIDKLYQSLLMSKNLSDSEYVVLFAILELGEGCLQKDIADNSYVNKKTINATIKKLEKNELIILKAGKYPNMHIYLTKKGKNYIKEKIFPIIDIENRVLENMPESEFDHLTEIYLKYIKLLKNQMDES